MQLDDALQLLGSYGRYQIILFLAISVFDNLPSIWHMSVMTFIGYEPKHHCKQPDNVRGNFTWASASEDWKPEKCDVYRYDNGTGSNITTQCPNGWQYDQSLIKTSIVTEWDLVCEKNLLPETSLVFFNLGVMCGAIMFGFLSDKFGRKISFIGALVLQAIFGSLTAAAPNFSMFVILRVLVGVMEQGVNITGYIMAIELFPPKQRTIFGVAHEFFWAIGGAMVPLFAYFIRDWRQLQLCVSLPSILGLALWWLIPESTVWLLAKGRVQEAESNLEKIARCNHKTLPANCLGDYAKKSDTTKEDVVEEKLREHTYTALDLFRTHQLRKITLCICSLWALNTMVYYGLSYNTPNLYGDVYFNFFLGQMVEIPSVAVTLYVIYKFGRRWPLLLFHVFGGIMCIASPFVPPKSGNGADLTWLSVSFAMIAKFCINASFTIIYIYSPEIYPTVLRNTGAGMASFSGRFGGIIYPYINYMSKMNTNLKGTQLPLLVFGIVSIVGGFMALPLPETRNKPLPETVADIEHYDKFCKEMEQKHRGEQLSTVYNGNAKELSALNA